MTRLGILPLAVLLAIAASMTIAPVASAQDVIVEERTYSVTTDDPAYIDEDPAAVVDDDETVIIRDDDDAVLDDDDADTAVVAETIISDSDAVDRCSARFRSFDPDTGTYVGYDGLTHRCPYLP